MMKKFFLLTPVIFCFLALCAFLPKQQDRSLAVSAWAETDSIFILEAASSGMMEVQLSNLAVQHGASQEVKDFGSMMVRDHSKANEELKAIAARLNITIPDSLMRKDQRHVNHLADLTGNVFDRAYLRMMVEEHKDDIDEFEDHASKAKDAGLKEFASRQLPILKRHLERATALRK